MPTQKSAPKDPWEKPAPKGSRHTKISPKNKAKAKAAAKKVGRKYPNWVDNMKAAEGQKRSSKSEKGE